MYICIISIFVEPFRLPALALRASIFLCEILKSRSKYKDLTQFLVKLISDVSDVVCFVLQMN